MKTILLLTMSCACLLCAAQVYEPAFFDPDQPFYFAKKSPGTNVCQVNDLMTGELIKSFAVREETMAFTTSPNNKFVYAHEYGGEYNRELKKVIQYDLETLDTVVFLVPSSIDNQPLFENESTVTRTDYKMAVYTKTVYLEILGACRADHTLYFKRAVIENNDNVITIQYDAVYEMDFNAGTMKKILSLSETSAKINLALITKTQYLFLSDLSGKVDIYDLEKRTLFKSIQLNVPSFPNALSVFFSAAPVEERLSYSIIDSDPNKKRKYVQYYDLVKNQTLYEETRTGEEADIQLVWYGDNPKFWVKREANYQIPAQDRGYVVFRDQQLTDVMINTKGVRSSGFDDQSDFMVTYESGKKEYYDFSSGKLLRTEESTTIGVMEDF